MDTARPMDLFRFTAAKQLSIISSENIFPARIERVLTEHPNVAECWSVEPLLDGKTHPPLM